MKNGNVTIVNKELEKVQRDLNVNVLFFSFLFLYVGCAWQNRG